MSRRSRSELKPPPEPRPKRPKIHFQRCDMTEKIMFPDAAPALDSALRSARRTGLAMRAYYHEYCQSWHLTKRH